MLVTERTDALLSRQWARTTQRDVLAESVIRVPSALSMQVQKSDDRYSLLIWLLEYWYIDKNYLKNINYEFVL